MIPHPRRSLIPALTAVTHSFSPVVARASPCSKISQIVDDDEIDSPRRARRRRRRPRRRDMSAKKWLDANNISSLGKKLRASAEETLNTLVETNANERRRGPVDARARASAEEDVANVACGTEWMRESADARVRELTELNQRKDEELAALKSALRRATEESATATASTSVGTSNEEHEREVKKLRDAKAWAEEECRAFEKECDEARDERDAMKEALEEAKRAREMAEKELETLKTVTSEEGSGRSVDREGAEGVGEEAVKRADAEKDAAEAEALRLMTEERDAALNKVKSVERVTGTLQKQIKEYAKRVPELEKERDAMRGDLHEVAESLAAARREVVDLEKSKADSDARWSELSASHEALKKEKDGLDAELSSLKKRADNSKQVQSDVEAAKQRVSEGALKKSLAEVKENLSAATAQIKTLTSDLSARENEITEIKESKEMNDLEIGRLREEVKSLTGAVAERNTAMSELAELRSELADAKRALDTSTFAGTSLEEVEAARDKAEHELLTMARRVTALEQQLFEAQRAQEEAAAEIEQKVDVSSRGDKDAIEKLKVKCDELETAQKEAERGVGKLTADLKAAREALAESEKVVAAAKATDNELKSKLEAAEIRVMNANALAEASKNALDEHKRKSAEISQSVQEALRAERDAAQKAAEAAERDRDAWNEKCTEARDTLERWREKARKLMIEKDAELEAVRCGASPMRSKAALFDEDDDGDDITAPDDTSTTATVDTHAPSKVDDVHAEYLAAVVRRYFLLPYDDYDRADALVPVITTILGFSVEDEFRIRAHRASQRVKASRLFGGYL